jgi:hypothetical protein
MGRAPFQLTRCTILRHSAQGRAPSEFVLSACQEVTLSRMNPRNEATTANCSLGFAALSVEAQTLHSFRHRACGPAVLGTLAHLQQGSPSCCCLSHDAQAAFQCCMVSGTARTCSMGTLSARTMLRPNLNCTLASQRQQGSRAKAMRVARASSKNWRSPSACVFQLAPVAEGPWKAEP